MDIEVLELSASSKEAQEKHAEMLMKVLLLLLLTLLLLLSSELPAPDAHSRCDACRVWRRCVASRAGGGRAPCAEDRRAH